jgi:hypothetical protein
MKFNNDQNDLPIEEAIKMLPDNEVIHTFRNPVHNLLLGCDVEKSKIIKLFETCPPQLSGELAAGMNHGLVIKDETGYMFIETATETYNISEMIEIVKKNLGLKK